MDENPYKAPQVTNHDDSRSRKKRLRMPSSVSALVFLTMPIWLAIFGSLIATLAWELFR